MAVCWRSVTLYVILLHRPSAPVTPVLGIQKVIKMAAEGFYRREVDGTPYFDFSTEKFMFKRTWQVVFWGTRNDFGHPKQLAARLKAREGLHSKVVTPESRKRGTKNGKMNAVIYKSAFKKWALLKKEWTLFVLSIYCESFFSSPGTMSQNWFLSTVLPVHHMHCKFAGFWWWMFLCIFIFQWQSKRRIFHI